MKKTILSLLLVLTCLAQASAYTFEVDGIYYNKNGSNATVTYRDNNYNSYSGEVTIPSTVTYDGTTYTVTAIGDYAFQNCSALTAITLPETVASIGMGAFNGCTSLATAKLPANANSIGSQAFQNCSVLESIVIPEGVKTITQQCFAGCSSLKDVTIPSTVTSIYIHSSAFYNPFNGCSAITNLTWNAVRCESRGGMPTANIETVTIGDEVTLLPADFVRNSKITQVDIPAKVTNIGTNAFNGCSKLIMVTSRALVPPTMAARNCFSCYDTATLFAPISTVNDYRNAEYWKEFFQIIGANFDGLLGDVNGDGSINIADIVMVIDLILRGIYSPYADMNGDGLITISDINAIIAIVLH